MQDTITSPLGVSIGTTEIEALAVTAAKLAANAVETAKINADAVTPTKINVPGLVGTDGKIAAINSTNFSNLSGANLTDVPFDYRYLAQGTVTQDDAGSVEVIDYTLGTNELSDNDEIEIDLFADHTSASYFMIRVYDGTNTYNLSSGSVSGAVFLGAKIIQNTNIGTSNLTIVSRSNTTLALSDSTTMIANWIKANTTHIMAHVDGAHGHYWANLYVKKKP